MPPALQAALDKAMEGLNYRSGVSEEERKRIIDYYLKPHLAAMDRRMELLSAQFRQRGMFGSGRHGMAMLNAFEAMKRQMAEDVTIPLLRAELDKAGAERRANIQLVADLARQAQESGAGAGPPHGPVSRRGRRWRSRWRRWTTPCSATWWPDGTARSPCPTAAR